MEEMMRDEEIITMFLEDIRKRPDSPQSAANSGLVKAVRAAVMKEFPEAVIIENGWVQWVAATPAAKKKLVQQLKGKAERLEQELAVVRGNIEKLI